MNFEKISSGKFAGFKDAQILNVHKVRGGANTSAGSKSLGGGSCEMSYTSDTSSGGTTTYHGATYSGCDCPEE